MSFYDDASIVLIPSGYKTSKLYSQKPTDGSGDLTFTRTGSTATRVNESGLIERCRTNQFTYSEQFDNSDWVKSAVTISTNTIISPDGNLTADTVVPNATSGFRYITKAVNTANSTVSIYVKKKELNYILFGTAQDTVIVNLQNGTLSENSDASNTYSIQTLLNGWYRVSASNFTSNNYSFFVLFGVDSNGQNIATNGTDGVYIWGAQFEIGDIATAYIPTTSAAVTVGPIANVPRLDYTGGGCPKLLMEPTRTNLITYANQFDNAAWLKLSATVVANQSISPDGYTNADSIQFASNGYIYQNFPGINYSAGASYTFSIFIKSNLRAIQWGGATQAGTDTYSIQDYGNGWYRQILTRTFTNAGSNVSIQTFLIQTQPIGSTLFYAYGAQLEAGSYATSYIPTFNASVTRNADSASKTGISSLIGQTEGTIFAEIDYKPHSVDFESIISLKGATTSQYIEFVFTAQNKLIVGIYNSGTQASFLSNVLSSGKYKIAFAYKQNDFIVYINGSQVFTDTSGTVPALSDIGLGYDIGSNIYQVSQGINQTLIFKTRLSNSDLATLTTL